MHEVVPLDEEIEGVSYDRESRAWRVEWKQGENHREARFHVKDYREQGKTLGIASKFAYRAATAYQKVVNGQSSKTKKNASGVQGVTWIAGREQWQAEMRANGKLLRTRFKPKDMSEEEIENARLEAVKARIELETKHTYDGS